MKAAATKELWHGHSDFCTPEQLRLQQHLRSRKLKCKMRASLGPRMSAMSDCAAAAGLCRSCHL
eukprot:2180961-Pleurochrysis_carterae.AAC.1